MLPGSKLSTDWENAPKNDSFSIPFLYLELRREHQEDYKKVRKSKAGKSLWLDYKIVYKILRFLESGYTPQGSEKEDYSGTSKVLT